MRRVALALAAVVLAVLVVRPAPVAAAPTTSPSVAYRPPVSGPVVDAYRPPPRPWDAGNRGIDYATVAGARVAAAADGEVVFAGPVAGALHVVLLHADGIRTSYSFLDSIAVHRGDRVRQGQTVGTSGDRLHFGARAGDDYIDPATLFGSGPPDVYLVPDEQRRPATEARERAGLLQSLVGLAKRAAGASAEGVNWARDQGGEAARAAVSGAVAAGQSAAEVWTAQLSGQLEELHGLLDYANDLNPAAIAYRELSVVSRWNQQKNHCTSASVIPPPLATRHIAVTVAGFDSTSENNMDKKKRAAIDHVDTAALGYAEADVMRFSYAGGTIANSPYNGRVTSQDIRVSGRRLRQLLERVGQENPGVPVDIIAHSEGSIVAREALAQESDKGDPALPPLNSMVLIGAPNQGADLATAGVMLGKSTVGAVGEKLYSALRPGEADITGPAMHQLAETSTLLARLNRTPLPPGLHVTSIGARTDPVVPGRRTFLAGADNIVVDSGGGVHTHDQIPGSAAATREINLALHGMAPTCQTLADMMADEAVSESITVGEDVLGRGLWAAGRWADVAAPPALLPTRANEPRTNEPKEVP
ncbi:MAG: peptidoglycan DD-metalloendopeptidase family protein [Acidimicrobiales bacterium]